MATIQKQLIGKHTLIGDPMSNTDYVFSVPSTPQGTSLLNGIDNQVLEEVYIAVDTTLGNVNIYLPSIATFNGAWNAKIYIIVTNHSNTTTIYPYNTEMYYNTINGFYSVNATAPYDAWYLHVVQDTMWMALKCPGPILL